MHLSRQFAGGHVFSEGLLIKLLSEAYYNPRIPAIVTMLLSGGGPTTPQLQLLPAPPETRGQTFGSLFTSFLRRPGGGMHAIGLYRVARDEHNQPMEYVVCKPPSELRIVASDQVFVLVHAEKEEAGTARDRESIASEAE